MTPACGPPNNYLLRRDLRERICPFSGQASTPPARRATNYSNSPSMVGRSPSDAPSARTARRTHSNEGARIGEPVRIRQVFRTATPAWGHRLYFELPQPARDVTVSIDYTNTNIAEMGVIESVATTQPTQLIRSPESVSGRTASVEATGLADAEGRVHIHIDARYRITPRRHPAQGSLTEPNDDVQGRRRELFCSDQQRAPRPPLQRGRSPRWRDLAARLPS